jgi:hypothetical protein
MFRQCAAVLSVGRTRCRQQTNHQSFSAGLFCAMLASFFTLDQQAGGSASKHAAWCGMPQGTLTSIEC